MNCGYGHTDVDKTNGISFFSVGRTIVDAQPKFSSGNACPKCGKH
jgi:hypothetical protein